MISINLLSLKKKFLIISLLSAISITSNTNSFALTKGMARGGAVAIGATAGVATYMIVTSKKSESSNSILAFVEVPGNMMISTIGISTGIIVGGITWWYTSGWLNSLTLEGKFIMAQQLLSAVELDSIVNLSFQSAEDLTNQIQAKLGYSMSQLEIKKHLMSCSQILSKITPILDSADKEARLDGSLTTLVDQIQTLCKKASALAKTIEQQLTIVKQP